VFKQAHFRFHFDDSADRRLFGVTWKMADRLPPAGVPLDFRGEAGLESFQRPQLELIDRRPSE